MQCTNYILAMCVFKTKRVHSLKYSTLIKIISFDFCSLVLLEIIKYNPLFKSILLKSFFIFHTFCRIESKIITQPCTDRVL